MSEVYAPRLRILCDPVYLQVARLNGSSTYAKFVGVVKELADRGHFVYWCIPDVGDRYVPHEIEDHANVGIIRTEYIQDQFVADGIVTDDFFNLFNRVAGKYQIDAMITCRTGMALQYKRLLEPPRFHDTEKDYTDKGYGLPIMILEEFPQTRERQHVSRSYWLSQCTGYLSAERTVFLSAHNREEVVKEMMEWFNLSNVTKFTKEQARIIPSGIRCDELDGYFDEKVWPSEKGFNVVSIGRIFGKAKIEYLPWFDYLYKAGLSDVSLTLSLSGTLSGPMRAKLAKTGFDTKNNFGRQFTVKENNPRDNFLRMLRRYHAFVCPLLHYDHPTGILEAVYLGLPGVLPASDYQRSFFPDWPWVIDAEDKAALLANLLWIRENRAEARAMVAPYRATIRAQYDAPTNIRLLVDDLEGISRTKINHFKTSSGVVNLLRELKGESYTWPDVVSYLRNSGWMGVSIGDMSIRTTFTYARGAIHHAMRLIGYVDICDGPVERFVRRDVFDGQTSAKPKLKIRKRLSA